MENVLKSHSALCKDFLAFQRHFVSNYLFYCFIFHSNRLIFCFSLEKQIDKSSSFASVRKDPCIVAEIFVACEYLTSPCHTLRGSVSTCNSVRRKIIIFLLSTEHIVEEHRQTPMFAEEPVTRPRIRTRVSSDIFLLSPGI